MKDKELMSKIISKLELEPGLILLHHNADIDAVGSAIALKSAYPSYYIGAYQKVSQMSKRILNHFKDIKIIHSPKIEQFNTVLIIDASTPSQVGISQDAIVNPIILDHHICNNIWKTEYYYCDDSKSSCAELILELLDFINFKIDQQTALALLLAILADTGHFKFANQLSFLNFARLLEIGNLTMADVLRVIEAKDIVEISQRIAHLKGAQRLKYRRVNGYLVAISQLSSYEASMCKNLLALGADVAFVGAQHGENIRVSARANTELVNSGLHLGEFFQSLSTDLTFEGGGHGGAAGINGIGDVEMVLNACLNKITSDLEKIS